MLLETGAVLDDTYRIVKLLGKGAMGNVYMIERIKDDKTFVVKELVFSSETGPEPETAWEIFRREAEFMMKFEHSGIPRMHGTFTQDGREYLIMDFIEGKNLEEIINSSEIPLNEKDAVKWAIELAEIIDYLHNSFHKPVVYRDLKPSNIIITPEGKAKLVDFGIVRYYNPDKNTDTFSYGSPGYAPPEQYKGRGQTTPQTDVFALGVILYQMLTKYDPTEKPFHFPPPGALNLSLSEELEDIIKKAIQLDPLKRYISMAEFGKVLEKYYKKVLYPPPRKESYSPRKNETAETIIMYFIILAFSGLLCLGNKYSSITITATIFSVIFLIVGIVPCLWVLVNRTASLRLIHLMIVVFVTLIYTMIFAPEFRCSNNMNLLHTCELNLKNIATALEVYAEDYEGNYPPSLSYLTEKTTSSGDFYIESLPECVGLEKSSYGYKSCEKSHSFTLWCNSLENHSGIYSITGCWPQYNVKEGIKYNP